MKTLSFSLKAQDNKNDSINVLVPYSSILIANEKSILLEQYKIQNELLEMKVEVQENMLFLSNSIIAKKDSMINIYADELKRYNKIESKYNNAKVQRNIFAGSTIVSIILILLL